MTCWIATEIDGGRQLTLLIWTLDRCEPLVAATLQECEQRFDRLRPRNWLA